MKSTTEYASAGRTTFLCPASPLTKFAKVSGFLQALASQTENSVTFSGPPTANASVEIFYGNDIVIPPGNRNSAGVSASMPAPSGDRGLTLFLSVTTVAGAATLDCQVQQLDMVSGAWFNVPGAAFSQVTAISAASLSIFPGAQPVANSVVNGAVRNQYRISYTVAGGVIVFSIGAQAY